jgi:hypothetical protein
LGSLVCDAGYAPAVRVRNKRQGHTVAATALANDLAAISGARSKTGVGLVCARQTNKARPATPPRSNDDLLPIASDLSSVHLRIAPPQASRRSPRFLLYHSLSFL